jgi:hypothetical protein
MRRRRRQRLRRRGAGGRKASEEFSFFEKKKQKTFPGASRALARGTRQTGKSFLLLFFKKAALPF